MLPKCVIVQQIVDYIICNWQWLLPVFLSVVESIFIICLKQRPKYYGYYMDICNAVKEAEDIFIGPGRGKEKLKYVVQKVCRMHDMDPKLWAETIVYQVEKILDLPNKKKGGQ